MRERNRPTACIWTAGRITRERRLAAYASPIADLALPLGSRASNGHLTHGCNTADGWSHERLLPAGVAQLHCRAGSAPAAAVAARAGPRGRYQRVGECAGVEPRRSIRRCHRRRNPAALPWLADGGTAGVLALPRPHHAT